MKLLVSFRRSNVRLSSGHWLFKKRHSLRFLWFALLAYKRIAYSGDQCWVTLEEIAALPNWRGRDAHHISTNVGRYLQSPELRAASIVAGTWAGPYRLECSPIDVTFDIPLASVRAKLHLGAMKLIKRPALLEFTWQYATALSLIFRGKLHSIEGAMIQKTAFGRLQKLTERPKYGPLLRLFASLTAVDVLFRGGRIKAARKTLEDSQDLLRKVVDQPLKGQFYLKLAWAYQRASSGTASNRLVESALAQAAKYAEGSGDRATLGLLDHRMAMYLTKRGKHRDAVSHLVRALQAHLIVGNYNLVQAACADIGSIIHRLGRNYYDEARQWLLASFLVARRMGIGRDDAHGEMILGKIHIEQKHRSLSWTWLQRAERVATGAGNHINLADTRMMLALWHQRFGSRKTVIRTLSDAIITYRKLYEFDAAQKEKYMSRKFPGVWDEVLERLKNRRPTK